MRRALLLSALAACGGAAAPAPAPRAVSAPEEAPPAPPVDAAPGPGFDAVVVGTAMVPASAVAVGIMMIDDVEAKTIVISDQPTTCEEATASWGADRTDRTIVISAMGWADGHVTRYEEPEGFVPSFEGPDESKMTVDGPMRWSEIGLGTVTTLRATDEVGAVGRIRVDLTGVDGTSHARGEIDVVQCE